MAAANLESVGLAVHKADDDSIQLGKRIIRTNGIDTEIFIGKHTLTNTLINKDENFDLLLDLVKRTHYTSIIVSQTAIDDLLKQQAILREVAKNSHLRNLQLYHLNIPQQLFHSLMQLPLLSLTLFQCTVINDKGEAQEIGPLFAQCKTLRSLTLIGPAANDMTAKEIATLPNLEALCVEYARLTPTGVEQLLVANRLRHLELFVHDDYRNTLEEITKLLLDNENLLFFICNGTIDERLRQRLTQNRQKLPSDRANHLIIDGRPIYHVQYNHPTITAQVDRIVEGKSVSEITEIMNTIGFSANWFYMDHDHTERNTYLNILIANELHTDRICNILANLSPLINPNEYDHEWKNLLIIAAKVYSADKVFMKVLEVFGNRLDFEARDKDGCTALHYLCAYGKLALAEALLKLKPSLLNVRDFQGRTPLDYANMPEGDVCTILNSIDINPFRDAAIPFNQLISVLSDLNPKFNCATQSKDGRNSWELQSTLKDFEQLQPFINPHMTAEGNELIRIQFASMQEELRKHFSGKSIVDTCMQNRPALVKFLASLGGISFIRGSLVSNDANTAPLITPHFNHLSSAGNTGEELVVANVANVGINPNPENTAGTAGVAASAAIARG